jgi:ATP-dependent DNA helicase RecG
MTKQELNLILQEGEGYRTEFKENTSNLDKELTAFANASGGRIFLGITDSGEIKGINVTNKLKSQIQDIAQNCDPPVHIILKSLNNILIIEVREGKDKPYKCTGGFYNRIGPNSQKLKRDEILAFVKSEGKIKFDELVNKDFTDKDFYEEKLDQFLQMAGISKVIDTPSILKNLFVAEIQEGRLYYYNTAVLFFAKDLNNHFFHTVVTCAIYKGKDKATVLDRKDFNKDLIYNIDETMLYLKQHLKVRYEFDGSPTRKEIPEIPFEALREAVINAVIHRDYFIKGANVMVEIFDDRVEISSPGGLPKGLDIKDFGKKSVLRNPNIANLIQRIEYIEKMGTGITRIQNLMKQAGLTPVEYEFTGFVTAKYNRPIKDSGKIAQENTQEVTQENTQEVILKLLNENPKLTRMKIAELSGLTPDSVKYHLDKLKSKSRIRHIGATKKGYWEVIED